MQVAFFWFFCWSAPDSQTHGLSQRSEMKKGRW
jgi:hypothetical protein